MAIARNLNFTEVRDEPMSQDAGAMLEPAGFYVAAGAAGPRSVVA